MKVIGSWKFSFMKKCGKLFETRQKVRFTAFYLLQILYKKLAIPFKNQK